MITQVEVNDFIGPEKEQRSKYRSLILVTVKFLDDWHLKLVVHLKKIKDD